MSAWEGIRQDEQTSPIVSVPTEKMWRGDFSEIATPDPEPVYPRAVRGQHHPELRCSRPSRCSCARYYPLPNMPGTASNYQGPAAGQGRARPGAVPRRSEHRDQGSALVPLQLARFVRGPRAVGPRDPAGVAAARQQELARLVHALAGVEPPQRLPDRLPPDGRGHAELFLGERHRGRRLGPRHPRLRRRRRVRKPRDPQLRHQRVQRPGPGRHQLAPVRHHVPALGRALVYARVAQPSRRVRRPPDGDVAAVGQPASRRVQFHRRHVGLLHGGLHARRAAERRDDRLDGHGTRGTLAEWLLRERRVATDAEDDAQPRPALRAEYGGADLRRLRLGTERGLHADHPVDEPGGLPGARVQAARAEPRRHRAAARRDLPADRQDGAPRRLGYLLQPEPDEHVHVSDEQPAARPAVHLQQRHRQPDAHARAAHRRRHQRRPRTSRRRTAICRTRGRTSGASTSSTSCGGQRSSRSSTSRPGRRTSIAASSSIRPRPLPGPSRRAGRIPTSAVSG